MKPNREKLNHPESPAAAIAEVDPSPIDAVAAETA